MIIDNGIATGTFTLTGGLIMTGSGNVGMTGSFTGSFSGSYIGSLLGSASYAITSSFANNFTVANTLTAQTLVVQTITSSVLYSSGSNIFGNNLDNTQVFTGSVNITGSLTVNGILIQTVTTNRQTASYTLVLADRGKLVEMNVATANNLTIPLNSSVAFPIGTQIDLSQYGAGQTTVVATGGVTIRSTNSWVKLNAQYAAATLIKIGTDEWYLFGNLNA
jgi:hypothetical protein